MQTYQSTPDYYRDYIEHGWLKDQAAKVHKYIERWRGKNGKWYYRYKSKAEELSAKARRKKAGIINPAEISRTADYGTKHARVMRVGPNEIDNGRGFKRSPGLRNTYDRNWTWTFNKTKTTKVSSKISRKPKKKGNLTSRGYSDSKSSSNNKATEKKIARREHMDYLKSNSVRNTRYGWKENSNGSIIDRETGKKYTPYRRRKINK